MSRVRHLLAVVVALVVLASCGGHPVAVKPGPVQGVTEARATVARATAVAIDAERGAASVDQFGLDLLRRGLGLDKGNVALSPTSIATALSMARAGAAGSTAAEMDKVLHVGDPAGANQAMNSLAQQLASRNGTFPRGSDEPLAIELNAANTCFAQRGLPFEQPFLDELSRSYGAGVQLVDFQAPEAARRAVNSWVGAQTDNRIPALLAPGSPAPETRLVLVNAVYLKADWMVPFQKAQTVAATFNTPDGAVDLPFMHGNHARHYLAGDGWQAVELPYAGGKLAMTLLVPNQGQYDLVAGKLTPALLNSVDQAPTIGVDLHLPKFDIEHHLSLKAPLSSLGMPAAFSDHADFSAMTSQESLRIADVVHQANVTVDEKGTVAAAASAVIMEPTSAPVSNVTLVVDRPFLFFIRDLPTGAILFAGQVTNPAAK